MNDLSETQRNLLMVGSLMLGIGLILSGPLLGRYLLMRERRLNRTVRPQRELRAFRGIGETAEWLMSGDQKPRTDGPTRRLALVPSTLAPDPIVPIIPGNPARVFDAPTQDVPLQAPSVDGEPTEAETQPEPSTDLVRVLQEPTAGYSIIDAYVDEAELVLDEEPAEPTVAEIAFWRDPLASLVYPPEEIEEQGIPMAALAFDLLKANGALTGIGADLDVEWEAWNLYNKEESYA